MKRLLLLALLFISVKGYAAPQAHSLGDVKVSDIIYGPTNNAGVVTNSSPIIPTASYMTLMSTGGALFLRAKPTISTTTAFGGSTAIPNGFQLILGSTATIAYTLQDNAAVSGTLLNLTGPMAVVSSTTSIHLIYNGSTGMWNQIR